MQRIYDYSLFTCVYYKTLKNQLSHPENVYFTHTVTNEKKKDNANINSTLRLKQAVQINVTHNLTTVLHPFKISELTGKVQKYYAEF